MSLCQLLLLLLLLLICSTQASHFYGTVMTYNPKDTDGSGSTQVVLRYKLNFHGCTDLDVWSCLSGNCGTESTELHVVEQESGGEWCQREGVMTRQVPSTSPFELLLSGGNWINGIKNSIVSWSAVTLVELRNRSDTGRANRSPQTTVLPAVRVPSNCQRNLTLLAFDPDGDEVRCRYGNTSQAECNPCTPPSVLNLDLSCVLSFSPNSSSNDVGPYAVQLVMEDFPREPIVLTNTSGSQEVITTSTAISKLPVQFVFRVDSTVPSCTEGIYLPKFLPPTPANGAQLFVSVNQTLEVHVSAEANTSRISELLVSGPYDINNTVVTEGQFVIRWTPSDREDGESHAVCFVVQAVLNSVKYHSELRCVTMSVTSDQTTTTTTMAPTTVQQSTSTQETVTSDTTTTQSTSVTTPENTTPSPSTADSTQDQTTTTTMAPTTVQQSTSTQEPVTSDTTTTQSTSVTTPENTAPSPSTADSTQDQTTTTTTTTTTTMAPTTVQHSTSTQDPVTSDTTTTQSTSVTTPENTTPSPSTADSTQDQTMTTTMAPTTVQQSTSTQDPVTSDTTTTQSTSVTTPENTTASPSTADSTQDHTTTTTTMAPTTVQQSTSTQDPVTSDTTTTQSTSVTTPENTTASPSTADSTQVVVGLRIKISSLSPLTEDFIRNTVLQQLKDELLRRGVLPSDATLRLLSSTRL
ncbi:uncharacterized protein V6R79_020784 [Siganus canaliculatus]